MKPSISSTIKAIALVLISILCSCQPETRQAEFVVLSTSEVAIDGNTENGVVFSAEILLSKDEPILEKGFVYAFSSKPTLGTDVKVAAEEVGASKFSSKMMDALAPDSTYYVRSYAKTQSFLTYGNEVTFRSSGSKAPIIEKIEPAIAFWGDTILITGKNFDRSGKSNSVWFGEFEASKRWGTKDTIYVIVPPELNTKKSDVTVKLYGKTSANSKPFEIHSPVVISISRTEGQYPDTVVVKGDKFYVPQLKLMLKDVPCKIISKDKNSIRFVVPYVGEGGGFPLVLCQADESKVINGSFLCNEQIVYGFRPDGLYYGEPMVIRAKNLDFREFPFHIRINDVGMYPEYYSKYQDSVVFNLSNPWYSLQKENTYSIILEQWGIGDILFEGKFSFKDPLFKLVETETVVNGSLKVICKGRGPDGQCYLKGPVVESYYPSMDYWGSDKWSLQYELLPGNYDFYYEDFLGRSAEGQFEIKQPILRTLDRNIYRRDGSLIVIDGSNLPLNIWSVNSYFRIKDLKSKRVFDFNGRSGNLKLNEVNPRWIVGRGDYEIYLEVRGERISNTLPFSFEDDFVFVNSIPNFIQPSLWHVRAVNWGNNLLCVDGHTNYLINLSTKAIVKLPRCDDSVVNLIWLNDKLYAQLGGSSACLFNKTNYTWEPLKINLSQGEWVDVIYEHDSQLWLISSTGQVFKLDGETFKYHGQVEKYIMTDYVYSKNGQLFFVQETKIAVYDPSSFALMESINIDVQSLRKSEKNTVPCKHGLALHRDNTLAFFNPETKQIIIPNEIILPGYSNNILFSDENNELFLLNDEFIYKYNPQ